MALFRVPGLSTFNICEPKIDAAAPELQVPGWAQLLRQQRDDKKSTSQLLKFQGSAHHFLRRSPWSPGCRFSRMHVQQLLWCLE